MIIIIKKNGTPVGYWNESVGRNKDDDFDLYGGPLHRRIFLFLSHRRRSDELWTRSDGLVLVFFFASSRSPYSDFCEQFLFLPGTATSNPPPSLRRYYKFWFESYLFCFSIPAIASISSIVAVELLWIANFMPSTRMICCR